MGNVCGRAHVPDEAGVASSEVKQRAGSGHAVTAVAAPAVDCIQQALANARQELKKSTSHRFSSSYKLGKIIGHGAFAKVQVRRVHVGGGGVWEPSSPPRLAVSCCVKPRTALYARLVRATSQMLQLQPAGPRALRH